MIANKSLIHIYREILKFPAVEVQSLIPWTTREVARYLFDYRHIYLYIYLYLFICIFPLNSCYVILKKFCRNIAIPFYKTAFIDM